jgi:uncharacterized protein
MRVLVTGATGLIGSKLTDALLARGDEVVGLTRDPGNAGSAKPAVTWHAWEPALERPPEAALDGVDGVVNLIGESINQRWTEAAKRRITDSRVAATRNLVDAIGGVDRKPAALVSQSAVGYYGDRGAAVLNEGEPPGDSFDARLCADWEAAARDAEGPGVRVVVVRSGLVLDRDGGLLKQLLLPFKLGLGGPIAGGDQYMAWIHHDDEIGILLWALDNSSVEDTINSTAPNPVTNRELSKALGRALGRPAVLPVPKLALRGLMGSELAETASGGQRAVPHRALELGYEFRYPEIEPALRAAVG